MTTMPRSETVKRSASRARSKPILSPAGITHVLVDNAALQLGSLTDRDTLEEERILDHGALFDTNVRE